MKQSKYICIHGHFYQPPRENAWLEAVELQDSAAPFHDWNARINFECYAPNAVARILDEQQQIVDIVNNYANISFNFGPTLLSWMEKEDPTTYERILEADQISQTRFGGHGSAIAQVHSHLILPLCNLRDKETQTIWGIKDFESRFNRKPEGIWLAETAADTETLEVLAQQGIKYTILAPRQGKAIRKIGDKEWINVGHAEIDPRRPYLCKLPSGRTISLFFYDGNIAQGVAFKGLLNNGVHFAQRFTHAFDDDNSPQLAHIATDGESYGHHHKRGEMALASCLRHIEEHQLAHITNYGQYLELFPPEYEAQIHENSSWSCVHGVERWRTNCGCNSGRPNWHQEWRAPLRAALDWLRDELIPLYEKEAALYLKDVWVARNDYVTVLLDRNQENIDSFIKKHQRKTLKAEERTRLLRLMEMQRHAMLMYTSCGWFFDEISGLETNQILQYAKRAIHYAWQVANKDLHDEFVNRLAEAPSNVYENGAASYLKYVVPAQVGLTRVGMHYAASSIFEEYPEYLDFFNYIAESESFYRLSAGKQRIAVGQTTVKSKTTLSKKHFSFAVLYLGQQHIIGNISLDMEQSAFDEMAEGIHAAFKASDLGQVIGIMQEYFGKKKFTIWHLFRDEKQKILKQITQQSEQQVERAFRDIYNDNYQLMVRIEDGLIPVPEFFKTAAQFIVNHDLREVFNTDNGKLHVRNLEHICEEFNRWNLTIADEQAFKLAVNNRIFAEICDLEKTDEDIPKLEDLSRVLTLLKQLNVKLDFWQGQNAYFSILKTHEKGLWEYPSNEWKKAFEQLGKMLSVRRELILER
jgi:alpha-amylase/alpha-mannosidase (GH57 family)